MCMFANPVFDVSATKIFARLTGTGTQWLVYQMEYRSEVANAMILPLPVKLPAREESIRFVDLSKSSRFFDELINAFPPKHRISITCSAEKSLGDRSSALKVHHVGNFIASFVPTMDDFERLDPQFAIPRATWDLIPGYADFGFAVFQLSELEAKSHPMAFEFETRNQDVFFPTVHIHDGKIHPHEEFDHLLFLQHAGFDSVVSRYQNWDVADAATGFVRSKDVAQRYCDFSNGTGIVDPDLLIHRLDILGTYANEDKICQIAGNPKVRSFNYRKYSWMMPWLVVLAGMAWFFNRRQQLKNLKKADNQV